MLVFPFYGRRSTGGSERRAGFVLWQAVFIAFYFVVRAEGRTHRCPLRRYFFVIFALVSLVGLFSSYHILSVFASLAVCSCSAKRGWYTGAATVVLGRPLSRRVRKRRVQDDDAASLISPRAHVVRTPRVFWGLGRV